MSGNEKLSVTDFAKLMGVTPAAVSRAISAGRLVRSLSTQDNGRYLIDVSVGSQEWEMNRLRGKRNGEYDDEDDEDGEEGNKKLADIERKLRHYQAETTRIKFEELAGQLLGADEVRSELDRVLRLVRDGILSIPDRVSAELAAEKDPFAVRTRLDQEVRNVLENLSFKLKMPDDEFEELEEGPSA